MKYIIALSFLLFAHINIYAQCSIPYGKKTFHVLQQHRMNLPKPSIALNTTYTDITVEILNATYQGETKDMLVLTGDMLGGASPSFIIGRNCETVAEGKGIIYTILSSQRDGNHTYSLLTDKYGNFITFTILGEKGEKTFLVLK